MEVEPSQRLRPLDDGGAGVSATKSDEAVRIVTTAVSPHKLQAQPYPFYHRAAPVYLVSAVGW